MAATVAGLLRARAQRSGADPGLYFKSDGTWACWSWSEYWEQARRAAAGLRECGIRSGDHVVMLVTSVPEAVATLFGLWILGAVPTQVGLPYRLGDPGAFLDQLQETARRLSARRIILSADLAAAARSRAPVTPVLSAERILGEGGGGEVPDAVEGDGPALIQLTSGSTGHPRGVVISHQRLLRHLGHMTEAVPLAGDAAACVSWLPLHHDMGLIGGLLLPLYNGFRLHLMSPQSFRRNPFSWLSELSTARATCTVAPPSAYAICLMLAERARRAGVDLGSLSCAMVGAEPVSAALLRRFAEAFHPSGFRAEAFFPVYGLAEATVAVTFPRLLEPTRVDVVDRSVLEREGRAVPSVDGPFGAEFVSVGSPIPGTEVRIADERGQPLGPRRVGEILVRSDTLMCSYHDEGEATASTLVDGWLWTGDLGYQAEGLLYVTGRRKDLIIRGGHNLIPALLEEIVAGVHGVRPTGVAAVGVRSDELETELVYVVAETKVPAPERAALRERIREALRTHGIGVDRILLVATGTIPRTTSGKPRRATILQQIDSGELAAIPDA